MPTFSREEQGIALPSFISTVPTIAAGKVTYRLLGLMFLKTYAKLNKMQMIIEQFP